MSSGGCAWRSWATGAGGKLAGFIPEHSLLPDLPGAGLQLPSRGLRAGVNPSFSLANPPEQILWGSQSCAGLAWHCLLSSHQRGCGSCWRCTGVLRGVAGMGDLLKAGIKTET